MKLEVGMYVRTPKGLGRIETIEEDRSEITFNCDSGLSISFVKRGFTEEEMANTYEHSHNIIDLIEEGDYVNGNLIEMFYDCWNDEIEDYEDILGIAIYDDARMDCIEEIRPLRTLDIKSIVTKEQFESISYKVKE